MIAFLEGKLALAKPTEVILDVGGVGYRVFIPTSTFERLPKKGQVVRLLTHHYVREDAVHLFGFMSASERDVFEVMLGVTGVGPKLALAALSAMSPSELRSHVVAGDAGFLTSIPGVGRKTAERLIVELRDRFALLEAVDPSDVSGGGADQSASHKRDALAALEQLGFSRAAAEKALRGVLKGRDDAQSADELVRLVLRERS